MLVHRLPWAAGADPIVEPTEERLLFRRQLLTIDLQDPTAHEATILQWNDPVVTRLEASIRPRNKWELSHLSG